MLCMLCKSMSDVWSCMRKNHIEVLEAGRFSAILCLIVSQQILAISTVKGSMHFRRLDPTSPVLCRAPQHNNKGERASSISGLEFNITQWKRSHGANMRNMHQSSCTTPTSYFMRLALRALGQESGVCTGCFWSCSCSLASLASTLSTLAGGSSSWFGFWTHWKRNSEIDTVWINLVVILD